MSASPPVSLTEVTVTVDDCGDAAHAQISVAAPDLAETTQHTDDQILWALWRAANVLGRLAAILACDLDARRDEHGCRGEDRCGICPVNFQTRTSSGGGPAEPWWDCFDSGGQPVVTLCVPRGEKRLWLQRVTDTLAMIARQDKANGATW